MTSIKLLSLAIMLFIALLFSGCKGKPTKISEKAKVQLGTLKEHIGEKFELNNILDSSGDPVSLDFKTSEVTIIDFWFKDCPPCLEEMKQFADVLEGKEKKISIISLSVNQPWIWKPLVTNPTDRFSFLNLSVSNWKQYTLQTINNPKLKNEISFDRTEELKKRYSVSFFPAYFVVNKEGVIQSRPRSAVEFIRGYN
jgi:thiol-disulfide isomerase/thioredoxin